MSVQGRRSVEQDPLVVRFAGEIDAGDSGFAEDLLACVETADRVVVDLLNVTFIDSSVIRALVLAHRAVSAEAGWLRVVYSHHVVRRVIEMCGLAEVFPQYLTIEAALRDSPSAPPGSEGVHDGGHP